MKLNHLSLSAALAMASIGAASAGTVYLTGSTAFRGNTYNALTTDNVVFHPSPAVTTWGNATGSKGDYMVFVGTDKNGSALTLTCAWSGSDAGIADVAPQTPAATEQFSADALNSTPGTTVAHANEPTTLTAGHTVDIAMADNEQAFAAIYGNNVTPPAAITKEAKVGVVTFKWVRNPGLWTGNNVTDSMIRQALNGAGAKQVVFDGNPSGANAAKYVYVMGRTAGSGTRANTFGETGYGIFTPPNQIELSGNAMIDDPVGSGTFIGDIGFTSGSGLATAIKGTTTAATDRVQGGTGFSVIAYLGYNDAGSATSGGATELTYDGVSFSFAGVTDGQYPFWGWEYILENNTGGTQPDLVYTQLSGASGIPSTLPRGVLNTAPNGINLLDMNVTRNGGPDGDPSHN